MTSPLEGGGSNLAAAHPVKKESAKIRHKTPEDPGAMDSDMDAARLSGVAKNIPTARLFEMEQARGIRRFLYIWMARPYVAFSAGFSLFMMLSLFFNIYDLKWSSLFCFTCSNVKWCILYPSSVEVVMSALNTPAAAHPSISWPVTAFIVGTFAAFIAFGVMLLKSISSSQDSDSGMGSASDITNGSPDINGSGS